MPRAERSRPRPTPARRNERPVLVGFEFVSPPHRYSQAEVLHVAADALALSTGERERLRRIFDRAGVAWRGSSEPLSTVFGSSTFEERNRRAIAAATRDATTLARRLLSTAGAGVRPHALVSTSCTSFLIPAVDALVADALNLGPRLVRLPITEAGCAGGAVALARAADYLVAHPEDCAIVVAVESCSQTFRPLDRSSTNQVATALFGDGASGALLAGNQHPLARRAALRFLGSASFFFPGSLGMMGFALRQDGLELILDRRLPSFLSGRLAPAIDSFLDEHGVTRPDIARFALHPGGRAVVDAAERELGLSPHALADARQVLRDHGNMSSATILFVLDAAARAARSGDLILSVGFGPGFGVELSLWRTS
jgi:alkylresorcinol/alkylpyrone synthase